MQEAKAESSQLLPLAFMYDCPRDSNTLKLDPVLRAIVDALMESP
jgi:hypothetical protein